MAITDKKGTCTISVSCKAILDNMDLLDKDKWELVPKDGLIYGEKTVAFYEGESVFNVLQREMKKAGIQIELKTRQYTILHTLKALTTYMNLTRENFQAGCMK